MATRRPAAGLKVSPRAQTGFKVLDARISATDEVGAKRALADAKMPKAKTKVHVVTHGDKWATRTENRSRVGQIVDTQAEALDRARAQAQAAKTSVVIHGKNGRIRDVITPRGSKPSRKTT